jgi:Holliday junction resolvase RusA-like endonuclease
VKFTIPGRLAGLNDLIGATNNNRYGGNTLKREETERCAMWAIASKMAPISRAVGLRIVWIEPNRRRDIDNVAAGVKFILDGLVSAGKLPNDGRKWVKSISHEFPEPDKKNPRIEVEVAKI